MWYVGILAVFMIFGIVSSFIMDGVDAWGHIGGLVMGTLCGVLGLKGDRLNKKWIKITAWIVLSVITIALIAGTFTASVNKTSSEIFVD